MEDGYDLVIAGAGLVGLALAWVAAERGLTVAVVERDARCTGASVRNFGFVTVSGQRAGDTWRRARQARDVWARIAPLAGIAIAHRGLWVLARNAASLPVLRAFAATDMGAECTLHGPDELAARAPWLNAADAAGALYSPHELRVESRDALPRLARWLDERHAARFFWGEDVLEVAPGRVRTAARVLAAGRVALCPGAQMNGVARPWLAPLGIGRTQLQMLRVQPAPGFRVGAATMADLSLVRYPGWAALPQAAALREHLQGIEADSLAHGIHLIAVQNGDGTLVVGDSHHDADLAEPFADEAVDRLILRHLHQTLQVGESQILERWTGVYPTLPDTDCLILAPEPWLRVVVVTSGTGASTAFGIARDTFANW